MFDVERNNQWDCRAYICSVSDSSEWEGLDSIMLKTIPDFVKLHSDADTLRIELTFWKNIEVQHFFTNGQVRKNQLINKMLHSWNDIEIPLDESMTDQLILGREFYIAKFY